MSPDEKEKDTGAAEVPKEPEQETETELKDSIQEKEAVKEKEIKEEEAVQTEPEAQTEEKDDGTEAGKKAGVTFAPEAVEFLKILNASLHQEKPVNNFKKLYLGFDFGTTNLVLVALNEEGQPVSAVMDSSGTSIRDGVVVDYMGAIHGMQKCLDQLQERLGTFEALGAAAYPPGIHPKTAKVLANIVEALGFDCGGLYEEPVAAAVALELKDAALVDIGGGTTGISVLQNGQSVYTADEPTGGTHMTLVLAGNMNVTFDAAEAVKRDPSRKARFVPVLKPVIEKMGSIVREHLEASGYWGKVPVIVCGGGADLPGSDEILSNVVGTPVVMAPYPLLVTPAGIALSLCQEARK